MARPSFFQKVKPMKTQASVTTKYDLRDKVVKLVDLYNKQTNCRHLTLDIPYHNKNESLQDYKERLREYLSENIQNRVAYNKTNIAIPELKAGLRNELAKLVGKLDAHSSLCKGPGL